MAVLKEDVRFYYDGLSSSIVEYIDLDHHEKISVSNLISCINELSIHGDKRKVFKIIRDRITSQREKIMADRGVAGLTNNTNFRDKWNNSPFAYYDHYAAEELLCPSPEAEIKFPLGLMAIDGDAYSHDKVVIITDDEDFAIVKSGIIDLSSYIREFGYFIDSNPVGRIINGGSVLFPLRAR